MPQSRNPVEIFKSSQKYAARSKPIWAVRLRSTVESRAFYCRGGPVLEGATAGIYSFTVQCYEWLISISTHRFKAFCPFKRLAHACLFRMPDGRAACAANVILTQMELHTYCIIIICMSTVTIRTCFAKRALKKESPPS